VKSSINHVVMKFGQDTALQSLSLQLPELDHRRRPGKASTLQVHLGGPVWGCDGWRGSLYPESARNKDYLVHYGKALGAIELNATFYGIPPDERIVQWGESVPSDFRFCPKIPRHITNAKNLIDRIERTDKFWRVFGQLGEKLGPSFFQFSDKQGHEILGDLGTLLKKTPPQYKIGVELRHPDFYENNELLTDVVDFLASHNAFPVISDTLGRREVLHQSFVGDTAFVRFLGENGEDRDQERLEYWLERIIELQASGLRELFFFIHQPDEENSAFYFEWFSSVLNSVKDIEVKAITLYSSSNNSSSNNKEEQLGLL